ncbi:MULTISPECIES: polyprenyl synthetase family protein [unclassified Actinopolyspora]|uniref:polyprenyl synthetase family protein n=1 Tax=unclassified Actinopolyspora TaxID=2639451 RepID=UPI0013F5BA48|nr:MULTISPECIES: polyprenyl synthetase family protein [unclassified Actinopolyspora]NHD15516.1 polyprenyl synthetase family protein [Actinopolyspora sp. BKK2]NHE75270.1 polyprenyl synthetase family protein [Actinopolyspora sp. BKK1]
MTATVPSVLVGAREMVDPHLRRAIGRLDPDTRRVSEYHFGWTAADGTPEERSGKALRPALVLLSARAGNGTEEDALAGATAVELVHNFSLLHDDLMDGDLSRRHRPTAWSVFGRSTALLAGDALLGLANDVVLEEESPRALRAARDLAGTVRSLIAGQAADLDFEQRLDVGIEECQRMIAGKTAALIACSCSIGALLAGASEHTVERLHAFGFELGMAFQLVDDLLGLWGDPEETGKPVLSDLRARKKSVPVVHALNSGTDAGQRLRELYEQSEPLTETQLEQAAELLRRSGSEDWTRAETERRLTAARRQLHRAECEGVTEGLTELADFVLRRNQ